MLIATVPDELDRIVDVLQREMPRVDRLIVTGGLGGTPDDITREAVAAAFGVEQEVIPELADDLRSRFKGAPEYAARWAALPAGSRPLVNPLGGAPGLQLGNVWVLPGLPREMEAMFDHHAEEFRAERPIGVWRQQLQTRRVVDRRHPRGGHRALAHGHRRLVSRASSPDGPQVEVVLKSADADALAEAVAWIEPALAAL